MDIRLEPNGELLYAVGEYFPFVLEVQIESYG
jgi:hypothetical protein